MLKSCKRGIENEKYIKLLERKRKPNTQPSFRHLKMTLTKVLGYNVVTYVLIGSFLIEKVPGIVLRLN